MNEFFIIVYIMAICVLMWAMGWTMGENYVRMESLKAALKELDETLERIKNGLSQVQKKTR